MQRAIRRTAAMCIAFAMSACGGGGSGPTQAHQTWAGSSPPANPDSPTTAVDDTGAEEEDTTAAPASRATSTPAPKPPDWMALGAWRLDGDYQFAVRNADSPAYAWNGERWSIDPGAWGWTPANYVLPARATYAGSVEAFAAGSDEAVAGGLGVSLVANRLDFRLDFGGDAAGVTPDAPITRTIDDAARWADAHGFGGFTGATAFGIVGTLNYRAVDGGDVKAAYLGRLETIH